MTDRRRAVLALLLAPMAATAAAGPRKRIGVLIAGPTAKLPGLVSDLGAHLRSEGFDSGSVVIDARAADRDATRLAAAAAELARLKPDVLVTQGLAPTRALMAAMPTVPIVTLVSDPVQQGLARSLSRPGGQVTGLTWEYADVAGKQLTVLRTILPSLERLAVVRKADEDRLPAEALAKSARDAGLRVDEVTVADVAGAENAFRAIAGRRSAAFVFSFPGTDPALPAQAALRLGVPLMGSYPAQVDGGFLVAYSLYFENVVERWAAAVARILRGAKAADLPFELPSKSRLVVNARTAKALGIVLPTEIRVQAEEVIE